MAYYDVSADSNEPACEGKVKKFTDFQAACGICVKEQALNDPPDFPMLARRQQALDRTKEAPQETLNAVMYAFIN
ncbi:MAG: hypothetical protein P1U53_01875 [Sulfitobacter sp.]|nr:hypothetical protein [Sulfitobacter sp.]